MLGRGQKWFIFSVAIILFATASAKLLSAHGTASALNRLDPVLFLSNRRVFYLAGVVELVLSAYLLMSRSDGVRLGFIAWLATNFAVYRAGLWWNHSPNLCSCLGNLTDKISISPRILDAALLAILGWLFIGSYTFLFLNWLRRRKTTHREIKSSAQEIPVTV
jgi:hypothetical protein